MKSLFLTIVLFLPLLLYSKERIVVLSPAINEIVYALGAGDEIVANTTYSTYPKDAQNKPKVGGYFSVSLEKIIEQKPTLVLMQRNNLLLKPKLQKLGIKTRYISISSINDIKKAIGDIGKMVKKEENSKKIQKKIDNALATLKGIVENKKILIVFGKYFDLSSEIFISGNNLYFSDIIKASGNQNAFEEKNEKQPVLSYEGLAATNADIVYILTHDMSSEDEKKRLLSLWSKLPINAAKKGTIYINDSKYASMPSQRVILFIEDFKKVLEDAANRLK